MVALRLPGVAPTTMRPLSSALTFWHHRSSGSRLSNLPIHAMKKNVMRKLADGHGFLSILLNLRRVANGYQPIFLDYKIEALPRYGYGKPPHPELARILAANEDGYHQLLSQF